MSLPQRIEPGPGQESVWDYPRPPRLDRSSEHIRVEHAGLTIADTTNAWRVLETSQPPTFYLPIDDVATALLRPTRRRTMCEWKGIASYVDLVIDDLVVHDVGWYYDQPIPAFESIRDHFGFYPQRVDRCWVGDEAAQPNDGDFYGGWITSKVVGPFKGAPDTLGW